MPTSTPRVAVVVPVWNGARWLGDCLRALEAQSLTAHEVVVVDDGSTDGGVESAAREFTGIRWIRLPENRGFATAVDVGIRSTAAPFVALLNVDTRARPGWLQALAERLAAAGSEIGGVASKMLNMDDPSLVDDAGDLLSWYGSGRKRGHGRPAAELADEAEVFSPCAGAALYRREALERIGGFDPAYGSYFEDLDVGLRSRLLGYRFVYEPRAEVLHAGGGSGLPTGRYVALVTRNRLLTFAKSMPLSLLIRHLHRLILGQLYYLVAFARPHRTLQGWLGFALQLPRVLAARRWAARSSVIEPAELRHALARDLAEPSLTAIYRSRLSRLWGGRSTADPRAG